MANSKSYEMYKSAHEQEKQEFYDKFGNTEYYQFRVDERPCVIAYVKEDPMDVIVHEIKKQNGIFVFLVREKNDDIMHEIHIDDICLSHLEFVTDNIHIEELSPILKQFYDLKKRHSDALLLFRTGDFYETYCNDASEASRILGITLTKSSKTRDRENKPLAMAGFPYHALDTYLPKLIRAGKRVAICDQIEQPKPTAKRKITEMVNH